jgi:hypothetical protein
MLGSLRKKRNVIGRKKTDPEKNPPGPLIDLFRKLVTSGMKTDARDPGTWD